MVDTNYYHNEVTYPKLNDIKSQYYHNPNLKRTRNQSIIGDFWNRVDTCDIDINKELLMLAINTIGDTQTKLPECNGNNKKNRKINEKHPIITITDASFPPRSSSIYLNRAPGDLHRRGSIEMCMNPGIVTGSTIPSQRDLKGETIGRIQKPTNLPPPSEVPNFNIITTSLADYSYKSTPFGDVYYSPRFQDNKYIYRFVILTKGVRNEAYRILKNSGTYLLTEYQIIRELSIDLSPGWEHFMLYRNRLDELILRREINT